MPSRQIKGMRDAIPHHITYSNTITVFFMVLSIRSESNINVIALSGGVWQNRLLLARILARLHGEGFQVYFHRQAPTNDSSLALGQAAVAITKLTKRKKL